MMNLAWTPAFVRSWKKTISRSPQTATELERTLRLLAEDPFHPQLRTHKLKGKLEGAWACSVSYNLRILFQFMKHGSEEEILLVEVGTHDEIY